MNAESVFARLRAVLDPENAGDVVVRAVAGDAHRPEATGHWAPADAVVQASAAVQVVQTNGRADTNANANANTDARTHIPSTHGSTAPAVLRLLDAPEAADVEAPHGAPAAVWWRGQRWSIAQADGPERLSGDWWRAEAFARDYWRCSADDHGELLVYAESSGNAGTSDARPLPVRWFVQGWYD